MRKVRLLAVSALALVAGAADAMPVAQLSRQTPAFVEVQMNCTGPRCLTNGPIQQPYLRGTRPPQLPGREMLYRAPRAPKIKPQLPEMDYRVPRFERDRPLVRDIRPPDPTYRAVGVPQEHIDWCFGRYRSYRESDNSYQPFDGPRRQCQSPQD